MSKKRYLIMGAGELGRHLARTLSADGHDITIIDFDPARRDLLEEQLDVGFVLGNGCHVPVLETAEVSSCDLFVAVSSSDAANLAASLLAKHLGAPHTVVRVTAAEGVTEFGSTYERTFQVDLLLSTQLLTTTRILNHALGYNTLDIEYLARGALQVRRTSIEAGSMLERIPLAEAKLPRDCMVLAFISRDGEGDARELMIANGRSRARPGDDALVLGTGKAIDELERRLSGHSRDLGPVVIVGGGATARAVARGLEGRAPTLKIIERDRTRAEELAASFPKFEIVHGDATDPDTLDAAGVGTARTFIACTGQDDANLMACLLAQELGAQNLTALVEKSETSTLWRKVALLDVVSPRTLAAERIRQYIESDYESNIVSFEEGEAAVVQRRVAPESPVAGSRLADIELPDGLTVAAVIRAGRVGIAPDDLRLEVDDDVVLLVRGKAKAAAQRMFPGPEGE